MDELNKATFVPSILEEPVTFVYTRRRDRLLAFFWPPKRRKLRAMERLAGMAFTEIQRELNGAMMSLMLYGDATLPMNDNGPHC